MAARDLESGDTPLHIACSQGHITVLQALLSAGAPVNATDRYGNTPLHAACRLSSSEVAAATVRLLLAARAPVWVANQSGSTPLHVACESKLSGVARLLIEADAPLGIAGGSNQFMLGSLYHVKRMHLAHPQYVSHLQHHVMHAVGHKAQHCQYSHSRPISKVKLGTILALSVPTTPASASVHFSATYVAHLPICYRAKWLHAAACGQHAR